MAQTAPAAKMEMRERGAEGACPDDAGTLALMRTEIKCQWEGMPVTSLSQSRDGRM